MSGGHQAYRRVERVAQNVLPRRNHWRLEARAKRVGVFEERRRPDTLPVRRPVVPGRIVSSWEGLLMDEVVQSSIKCKTLATRKRDKKTDDMW